MPSSYIHDESAKHSSSDRLPGSPSHSQLESDFHISVLLGGIPLALFGALISFMVSSLQYFSCLYSIYNIFLYICERCSFLAFLKRISIETDQGSVLTGAPARPTGWLMAL